MAARAIFTRKNALLVLDALIYCLFSFDNGCGMTFLFPIFIEAFFHCIEKTAQDVDVFGFRAGAGKQVLQAADDAFAVAAVEKADVFHQALHMVDHAADLGMGGGVFFHFQMFHAAVGLAVDFVAHDLHGLGEVEREVVGIAVDGHQAVAGLHFFYAQAVGFVAEHQRGLLSCFGCRQQIGGQCARGLQFGGQFAAAAGQCAAQYGVGKGFFQCGADAGVFQYVGRAGSKDEAFFGQFERLRVCRVEHGRLGGHRGLHQVGCDEGQFGQPHGFHGAGGGADVARMAGAGEDDADV